VCVAAANAGTTSQDLKTGFLVGATPRAQQLAILVGVVSSALAIGAILLGLNRAATTYVAQAFPSFAADDARVEQELLAVPHVKSVQFVSKQQAYAQQAKLDPQAYALLTTNPLPDTFHVIPDNPVNVLLVSRALTPPAAGGTAGVIDGSIQSVSNKKNDTKKILEVTNLVTITAAVLTVLLTIASVLLIANTIRLSLYARRREVEVMKLVGATDWFIRWPFVIEGTFVGAAGALLASAVLGVTKIALLDPLANNWTLIEAPRTIAFSALAAVLLGAGVLVSSLGTGLSLRRFLRV